MQVNKSDGKNMDVTVDTLTYLASHEEGGLNLHNCTKYEEDGKLIIVISFLKY